MQYDQVSERAQEIDNLEELYCDGCNQRVHERNLDTSHRNEDTAEICDNCFEKAKHLRCMTAVELEIWEMTQIWLCNHCMDALSSSDSSDLDEYDAQVSDSMSRGLEDYDCMCDDCFRDLIELNNYYLRREQGNSGEGQSNIESNARVRSVSVARTEAEPFV